MITREFAAYKEPGTFEYVGSMNSRDYWFNSETNRAFATAVVDFFDDGKTVGIGFGRPWDAPADFWKQTEKLLADGTMVVKAELEEPTE